MRSLSKNKSTKESVLNISVVTILLILTVIVNIIIG